jgi:hypothetical protein
MRRKAPTAIATRPPDPAFLFRPKTYWGVLESVVSLIKGEKRRRKVIELLAAGRPEAIDEVLLGAELPKELAALLRAIEPSWLCGEDLPNLEPGEVEIARVVLRSQRTRVISVRARRLPHRVEVRVADDDGSVLSIHPLLAAVVQPLTKQELLGVIDGIRPAGVPMHEPDVIHATLSRHLAEGEPAEAVAQRVEADSLFYPGLRESYAAIVGAWCASRVETPIATVR